jgi:hypothetical protein
VEQTLTENSDQRLRIIPEGANRSHAYQQPEEQETHQEAQQEEGGQNNSAAATDKNATSNNRNHNNTQSVAKLEKEIEEFDSDDSDFEDDPALEAFRERRLAELKRAQIKQAENKAKGHGDYRTISQDEFLPECTGSEYVAVHFFHREFERCTILDFHLKKRFAQRTFRVNFFASMRKKHPFSLPN